MSVVHHRDAAGHLRQGKFILLLWMAVLSTATLGGRTHQASYIRPGTGWHVWESLGNPGRSATYSMWLRAHVEQGNGEATFHVTCAGRRIEAYLRTSFVILSEKNERYQKDLATVRLQFSGETATRTYLFSPLEDDHGFYIYNFDRSVDDPEKGIERFLGHASSSLAFEDSEGGTVTVSLDLAGMAELYSSLRQAVRSSVSMARIEPSLVAADGGKPIEDAGTTVAEQDEAASAPNEGDSEAEDLRSLNVFGLSKGLTLPEIAEKTRANPAPVPEQPDLYILPQIPLENPDFEVYLALVPQTDGLSEIRAVGKPIHSDGTGKALREVFYRNVALLEKIFGPCRLVDTGEVGAVDAPEKWMTELANGNARIMARWPGPETTDISEDVSRILLTAKSESRTIGRLVLQITFSNGRISGQGAPSGIP